MLEVKAVSLNIYIELNCMAGSKYIVDSESTVNITLQIKTRANFIFSKSVEDLEIA